MIRSLPPDAPVGDRFAEVLEQCRRYLLAVANAQLPPALRAKGGASDLVQDALASACRARPQFSGQTVGELRAWLRAILNNELATFRRRYTTTAARDVRRERSLVAAAGASAPCPSHEMARTDECRRMSERLAELPDDHRAVVVLRLEHNLTFGAIGVRIGRTEEACRKLFSRSLDRLRGRAGEPLCSVAS